MNSPKDTHLKNFVLSLALSLFLVASSLPSLETRAREKSETYDAGEDTKHPHDLVNIKKTTPFFLNRAQHDHPLCRRRRRHRRLLGRKDQYFEMVKKNRPVEPGSLSVMLPKGVNPPSSGSSHCHNRFPNSASRFCHLPDSRKP
ncbi:PREDICTED: uncharacterized protein LOC104812857 [Tarenaya hassleriana]|uniref:uncharacterized protein LOC104812857 n=1 Tax=Tarenaya hassleriana TaxID=28532 RepID=UPI00053C491C|nr:PREDICTED: uncharacterized protein LOC104812857 [Tarenaya hassleriana]